MKTLKRFINWLNELKTRVLDIESTYQGVIIACVAILGTLNILSPDTVKDVEETINMAAPAINDIIASIAAIAGILLGLFKIWQKKEMKD